MSLFKDLRMTRSDDRGAALVTVIGLVAGISALAVTLAVVSMNNLRNTTRDKQAGAALQIAEAGVAEAIEYIRGGTAGLGSLNCMEPAPGAAPSGACLTNPSGWTNAQSPQKVAVDGGACTAAKTCYAVWIGTVTPYNPPLSKFGVYRIHATGKFGDGPAARSVVVEVKARPHPFPMGIYGETMTGGGNTSVHRESLFTRNCVQQRAEDGSNSAGLRFDGDVDLAHDIPPAAHSVDHIVVGSNCTRARDQIHTASQPCADGSVSANIRNYRNYYDQSGDGGPLSGTSCYQRWTSPISGSTTVYPTTSKFTLSDLQSFGYRPRGLSDSIYASLKSRAQATGTYFTDTTSPRAALEALGGAQAVLYYELSASRKIVLGPSDIPSAYTRVESDGPTCPSSSSLVIVVAGGSLTLNSIGSGNSSPVTGLVASIFVPDGSYEGQGGVWVIGSLFANDLKLSGTQDFRLDKCFIANPPSAVLDVQVTNFREDDTRDIT